MFSTGRNPYDASSRMRLPQEHPCPRHLAWSNSRGACWQVLPPEKGHEGRGVGMQALVEAFEGPFAADGVAEEHRDKVDHLIAPEAPPGKAHVLGDGIQDALLAKIVHDERGLLNRTGRRRHGLG